MGSTANNGFTIIETMLFLGVAGMLTVGMLVGSGVAINQQRYLDSVNSLKSFIQQQYSEATNVVNGRQGTESCENAIIAQPPATSTPQARGTSECIMMGRYISVDSTGTRVIASNVVGYRTSNAREEANDILEITAHYRLGTSTVGQESVDVAWGAQIVKREGGQPMPFSMLILRSPLSGSIMTYTSEGNVTNLLSMLTVANSSTTRDLCIKPSSASITGNRMSVQISSFATNQGSVQIPPENASVCQA